MPKANSGIFKQYDIRGVYGKDFDSDFAFDFGRAVASHFEGQSIVIGKDGRPSSDLIELQVIEGALAAGMSVIDIAESSTPLFYHSVHRAGASAGIMVTASHNAREYNGFKVIREDGAVVGGVELHHIFESTDRKIGRGKLHNKNFIEDYIEKVITTADVQKLPFHIGVQAPSAERKVLDALSQRLGIVFSDSTTQGLSIVMDPDADRILFLENGQAIPADFTFLLLVEYFKFQPLVYGLSFSRSVREYLDARNIPAVRSKIGRLFMYENMQQHGAQFGGEVSGHFYFKSFNYLESPELLLTYVLKIIQDHKSTLASLVEPFIKYYKSPEISLPVRENVFSLLGQKYSDGKIDKLDGITVEYPDWWFNLRLSNTEPVMRFMVEANTKDLLDEKVKEIQSVVG